MATWDVLQSVSQYQTCHEAYSGGVVIDNKTVDDVSPFSLENPPGTTIGDAVMAELRQSYIAVLQTIRSLCPEYCNGTAWAWMGDRPKFASFRAVIMRIFVVLFGEYARIAVGYVNEDDMWTSVPLFLPQHLTGLDVVSRSGDFFCHQSIHNYAVYKQMCQYNIHDIVDDFVRTLRKCGFFSPTSNVYIIAASYDPQVAPAVREALCQIPDGADGGFGREFGIRKVAAHSPSDYACGGVVIRCPMSPSPDTWKIMKHEDIPQIRVDDVSPETVPFISDTRFAMLDEDEERRFLEMIAYCNKIIVMFAESVHHDESKSLEWVNRVIIAMLHKYCPNYMALIGAQYLQNICVANATSIPDTDPRPRAYFPDDVQYEKKITSDQAAICAQMAYCIASTLFSHITRTVICVGTPGSGKSTVSKIVTAMAGGSKFVFILTKNPSPFSLCNLPGSIVILTEDTVNGVGTEFIKSAVFEGLGVTRGTKTLVTIEQKHKDQYVIPEPGKSVFLQGNFPKAPPSDISNVITYTIQAATGSTSEAIIRRSMVAPPHLEMLCSGTANQKSSKGWTFDSSVLHDIKTPNTEVPFIIVASVLTAILGDAVEDKMYGLLGKYPSATMLQSYYRWKEFGEDPERIVKTTLDILLEKSVHTEFNINNGKKLVMCQGVHQSKIISKYKQVARMALGSIPQQYGHPVTVLACKYCYMVFGGSCEPHTAADIGSAYTNCVNINRSIIRQECPCAPEPLTNQARVRCMDCVEMVSVYDKYKLRDIVS